MDGIELSPFMTAQPGYSASTGNYGALLASIGDNASRGAAALGQGLGEAIAQHRQNVQDAAKADTTFQMMVPMMSKAGVKIDPDLLTKYGSASLSQKKGMLGAMAMEFGAAQKQQMDQATMDELRGRAQYYGEAGQARLQQQQEQADTDAGLGALFNQFGSMTPSGDDGSWTQGDLMKAVGAANQKLNPRAQAALIKQVFPTVMGGGVSYGKPTFTDVPGTDFTMANQGKQSFLVPKAGTMRSGAEVPTASDPGEGPQVSKDGKFYYDTHFKAWKPVGRESEEDEKMDFMNGRGRFAATGNTNGGSKSAPTATALPMKGNVIDPTALQPGQIYQTARGPAVWDGKQFNNQ